jgi:alpha-beta hydrolase superfamily lysophospholipase
MATVSDKDYSIFDRPELLNVLFHPRRDDESPTSDDSSRELLFEVSEKINIGAKLHMAAKKDPIILFFHGNGEIVSDYDDLGPLFTRMGINFFPFDYRGYGRSNGEPSVSAMMTDCHILFEKALEWLRKSGFIGKIIVMGRSLGSASAIEIASTHPAKTDGLIIESGFAYMMPLLRLLGLYGAIPGLDEAAGPMNFDKIKEIIMPTLVIHAQYDHIIPFTDGQTLYDNSGADDKILLEIKGADHNSIFSVGFGEYMKEVTTLADKLR